MSRSVTQRARAAITLANSLRLRPAQAAGVNEDQTDALVQRGHLCQEAAHFGGGEDDRKFELGIGPDQCHLGRPGTAEGFLPKELDGANGLGAGLAGDLLDGLEMNEILAQFLRGDLIGGLAQELAELTNAGVVSLFGAGTDGQERQVLGEGIKDGVRGTFFICMVLQYERLRVDCGAGRRLVRAPPVSRKKTSQANHQRTLPCAASQRSLPPPRQRLRSTKLTGANAGGPRQLPMRTRWAARVAQLGLGGSTHL